MGALLLFGVGTNVQAGWVLAVAALLLGILVAGLVLPLRALNGIDVTRSTPRTAFAGQPVGVSLHITNSSRQMRSLFRVSDDFCGRAHAVVETSLPGRTATFDADRVGARRGVHDAGTAVLESGAPFGVLTVRRTARIASPIVVYPTIYDASAWRLLGPAGWPAPSSLGDVSSVRDYRPGDPLRHIHWRSVARRGQLMVREFDREVNASTAVWADVPDRLDLADAVASVASSIALAALRAGEVSVGGRRARSSDAVLEWGARLESRAAPSSIAVDANAHVDGVVYVGTPGVTPVDRLRTLAASTPVVAVLVDDGDGARLASTLRGDGIVVAVVGADEIPSWFESGCIAS